MLPIVRRSFRRSTRWSSASGRSTWWWRMQASGCNGPLLELAPQHIEAMIGHQPEGHDLHGRRDAVPPDCCGRRRFRVAGVGRRAARIAPRVGLQRFEVRARWASRARSTTSCGSHGVRATNVAPGGIATDFRNGHRAHRGINRGHDDPGEVADTVVYCVTRPPTFRVLTLSYRPMNEASWG